MICVLLGKLFKVQDAEAPKLGGAVNLVPIHFALAVENFATTSPKICTEEGSDSINDFFGEVNGVDVVDCLGCEDGADEDPSTGYVDILPISRFGF
jgi:hypothetical protein